MVRPFFVLKSESSYPLCSSEGYSKKTFHHRDTEGTEKFKKTGLLCALCVSSERNERVVKRIINPDNSYWNEVDNQISLKNLPNSSVAFEVYGCRSVR